MKFIWLIPLLTIIGCDIFDSDPDEEKKYSIEVSVYGLDGELEIQSENMDTINIDSDGENKFEITLKNKEDYDIKIISAPEGQTCTIYNGKGSVEGRDVNDVNIICESNLYKISGYVSGLQGEVVVTLNESTELSLFRNGNFTFDELIQSAESYEVAVKESPKWYTCDVANGKGTVTNNDISSVNVKCVDNIVGTWNCGGGYTSVTFSDGGGFTPWEVFACFANRWRRQGDDIVISRGCGDKVITPTMSDINHLSWKDGSSTMTCTRK